MVCLRLTYHEKSCKPIVFNEVWLINNLDITIRTTNIEYRPLHKEELKKQISEMIEQGLIKKSKSPHRSTTFIVRNHTNIDLGTP